MTQHTIKYAVSTDPDDLISGTEDDVLRTYDSPEDAVEAIENDLHGEIGTRYVVEIDMHVVATATRPWAIKRGERP